MFLQKSVIAHSNVLIAVVGALTLSDQKILNRIINEWKTGKQAKLFVIHNLKNHDTVQQVNDYIEEVLMQSSTFTLEKTETFSLAPSSQTSAQAQPQTQTQNKSHPIYLQRVFNNNGIEQTIIHVILGKKGSPSGNFFNQGTLDYLQMQIKTHTSIAKFSLIEAMKGFIVSMGKDYFEKPFLEDKDVIIKDEKFILLQDEKAEIVLKKCLVDELGFSSLHSSTFAPKFICTKTKSHLIFELEIGDTVTDLVPSATHRDNLYYFSFRGNKKLSNEVKEEGSEEIFKSVDSGPFFLDVRIPMDKILLANYNFKYERKKYKTNNLMILYELQQNETEQKVDEV